MSKWIKVTDAKPRDCQIVLAKFWTWNDPKQGERTAPAIYQKGDDKYRSFEGGELYPPFEWMPICADSIE